jgi:hypothetical protein
VQVARDPGKRDRGSCTSGTPELSLEGKASHLDDEKWCYGFRWREVDGERGMLREAGSAIGGWEMGPSREIRGISKGYWQYIYDKCT